MIATCKIHKLRGCTWSDELVGRERDKTWWTNVLASYIVSGGFGWDAIPRVLQPVQFTPLPTQIFLLYNFFLKTYFQGSRFKVTFFNS